MQTFFSSIQPSLKRYLIRRSFLLTLPGFFLLLYMGIFLPLPSLERWGIWGFGFGFTLISCGMIPYRRVIHLETQPHRLSIDQKRLCFFHKKKGEIMFFHEEIDKFSFVDKKRFYGIRIHFKRGGSFLLPYFSKKTFEKVKNVST